MEYNRKTFPLYDSNVTFKLHYWKNIDLRQYNIVKFIRQGEEILQAAANNS